MELFKRTLVLTSWLVGVSAIWVALASFVGVTLASRAMMPKGETISTSADRAASEHESAADDEVSGRGPAHHPTARAVRPTK